MGSPPPAVAGVCEVCDVCDVCVGAEGSRPPLWDVALVSGAGFACEAAVRSPRAAVAVDVGAEFPSAGALGVEG